MYIISKHQVRIEKKDARDYGFNVNVVEFVGQGEVLAIVKAPDETISEHMGFVIDVYIKVRRRDDRDTNGLLTRIAIMGILTSKEFPHINEMNYITTLDHGRRRVHMFAKTIVFSRLDQKTAMEKEIDAELGSSPDMKKILPE